MGLIHVTVSLRVPGREDGVYEALFLVDTGATDSMAPAGELSRIGIRPVGSTTYELADGTLHEYPFGLAQIEFMGEITAGRVIFGPEGAEPILGVTALESVGITVDPSGRTLKRLPAIPLKELRRRCESPSQPPATTDL
jgi:clan AA aspartic protease